MIRLTLKPEPTTFAHKVREPGENVLALMAGKPLPHKRQGKPIAAKKKVGGQWVAKTIDDFEPYWQKCLDELYEAYQGICAYYCRYIERVDLPHVDHFQAKNVPDHFLVKHAPRPDLAYEWTNFRLACGYANACKNAYPDVLDPACIEDGWFQLDLLTLDVQPNPELDALVREKIEETIQRLKLRDKHVLASRQRAMAKFRHGLSIEFLRGDHPFLAKELDRRGITSPSQLPVVPPEVTDTIEPELLTPA